MLVFVFGGLGNLVLPVLVLWFWSGFGSVAVCWVWFGGSYMRALAGLFAVG